MSDVFENKGALAVTLLVAAANSLNKGQANYICDGVNDHVEVQAALDALPATGGEVLLLDGTYNIESSLVLDSYQTLKGCGRSTILTTSTTDVDIITATGGSGTEKTGIVISDLQIDGNSTSNNGILFTYVDYSIIFNVYTRRNGSADTALHRSGIFLLNSDFNTITNNICEANTYRGVYLYGSSHNNIIGNELLDNAAEGIYIKTSSDSNNVAHNVIYNSTLYALETDGTTDNSIRDNQCEDSGISGIYINESTYHTVIGNICRGNNRHGIYLAGGTDSVIEGNVCTENSQETNNTYDDIRLVSTSQTSIQGNVCRAGGKANKPKYGINITTAASANNKVIENDLYNDGFGTAPFNDAGLLTHVEDNNRGIHIDQIKMFRLMKNTSGVQCVVGNVVSLKAVAAGNEVTAPAAVGERQVYGMVAETIDNAAWGLVQVKGKTTQLKGTNAGGGNIVIGDNLITENGVRARKAAAATDPIFARALEALAAADGVIDAYIKSPWD